MHEKAYLHHLYNKHEEQFIRQIIWELIRSGYTDTVNDIIISYSSYWTSASGQDGAIRNWIYFPNQNSCKARKIHLNYGFPTLDDRLHRTVKPGRDRTIELSSVTTWRENAVRDWTPREGRGAAES